MIIAEFLRLQKSLFAPPARNRRRETKEFVRAMRFNVFLPINHPLEKKLTCFFKYTEYNRHLY